MHHNTLSHYGGCLVLPPETACSSLVISTSVLYTSILKSPVTALKTQAINPLSPWPLLLHTLQKEEKLLLFAPWVAERPVSQVTLEAS